MRCKGTAPCWADGGCRHRIKNSRRNELEKLYFKRTSERKEGLRMSGINTGYGNYSSKPVSTARSYEKTSDKKTSEAAAQEKQPAAKRTDTLEISGQRSAAAVDYKSKTTLGIKNEGMKDAVAKLIGGQAANASGKSGGPLNIESILRSYGVEPIKSDGSDDFWGAEKTANRILDFAKSLAGNNKEAFEKVKGAFKSAFGDCEKIWGGKLPDVCYDTLDRVNAGFDEWEKEINGSSAAEQ